MDVGQGVPAILSVYQEGDPARVSSLKLSADGLPVLQDQHISLSGDSHAKSQRQRQKHRENSHCTSPFLNLIPYQTLFSLKCSSNVCIDFATQETGGSPKTTLTRIMMRGSAVAVKAN
jgi:hypothetical protein